MKFTYPPTISELTSDGQCQPGVSSRYYRLVADWILPHIKDRPLVLVRCPDGQGKECFYQKHPGAGMLGSRNRERRSSGDQFANEGEQYFLG